MAKRKSKTDIENISDEEIKDGLNQKIDLGLNIDWGNVVSTGSTTFDLAISGDKVYGGGLPGGIITEFYGPSGSGKTSLLAEIAAYAQQNGGEARFADPEARLDKEYAKIYGVSIDRKNYSRPNTVNEMFDDLWDWKPINENGIINVSCADSLAALSTEIEMKERDLMGMKRAKDFSEGLRKTCRIIAENNWLLVCSNQEREGAKGITTPGGKAIPYYSSLRARVAPVFQGKRIKKTKKIHGVDHEKIIGVRSKVSITKSSISEPFREANISIIFNYGIDDLRENLIYLKETGNEKKYIYGDVGYTGIDRMIQHIEESDLIEDVRKSVIDRWLEIQDEFKKITLRKKKIRK